MQILYSNCTLYNREYIQMSNTFLNVTVCSMTNPRHVTITRTLIAVHCEESGNNFRVVFKMSKTIRMEQANEQ